MGYFAKKVAHFFIKILVHSKFICTFAPLFYTSN